MIQIPEEKQVVLNFDANALMKLQSGGWGDLPHIISTLPGVSIEIVDLVADIEVCNRLRNADGSFQQIKGEPPTGWIHHFINDAARKDFLPEFMAITQDHNASNEPLQKALVAGTAYQESSSDAKVQIVTTRYGAETNNYALEEGEEIIKIIRGDYKSRGEQAIMERENFMQHDPRTRVVITNDQVHQTIPDYVNDLDVGNQVNIASLNALLKSLEASFGKEINLRLPEGKVFSADNVIQDIIAKNPDQTVQRSKEWQDFCDIVGKKQHVEIVVDKTCIKTATIQQDEERSTQSSVKRRVAPPVKRSSISAEEAPTPLATALSDLSEYVEQHKDEVEKPKIRAMVEKPRLKSEMNIDTPTHDFEKPIKKEMVSHVAGVGAPTKNVSPVQKPVVPTSALGKKLQEALEQKGTILADALEVPSITPASDPIHDSATLPKDDNTPYFSEDMNLSDYLSRRDIIYALHLNSDYSDREKKSDNPHLSHIKEGENNGEMCRDLTVLLKMIAEHNGVMDGKEWDCGFRRNSSGVPTFMVHKDELPEIAQWLGVDFEAIQHYKNLPIKTDHPTMLYSKGQAALEIGISPKNPAFSEVWDMLVDLASGEKEAIRLQVGKPTSELDIGTFRSGPRTSVMVSNPRAIWEEIVANNPEIKNPDREVIGETPNILSIKIQHNSLDVSDIQNSEKRKGQQGVNR